MSFGKGRTNYQVERDIFYESFKDSISILIKSQKEEETYIKATLYDISASQFLSKEEKVSESRAYEQLLADIEEKYIRIRRIVFIGIYSFWEISLKELQDIKKEKHIKNKPNLKNCNFSKNNSIKEFIKILYNEITPELSILTENIRELRNYLVHGDLYEERKKYISELVQNHPEFKIHERQGSFYISDTAGLTYLCEIVYNELNNIENKLKEINTK